MYNHTVWSGQNVWKSRPSRPPRPLDGSFLAMKRHLPFWSFHLVAKEAAMAISNKKLQKIMQPGNEDEDDGFSETLKSNRI